MANEKKENDSEMTIESDQAIDSKVEQKEKKMVLAILIDILTKFEYIGL